MTSRLVRMSATVYFESRAWSVALVPDARIIGLLARRTRPADGITRPPIDDAAPPLAWPLLFKLRRLLRPPLPRRSTGALSPSSPLPVAVAPSDDALPEPFSARCDDGPRGELLALYAGLRPPVTPPAGPLGAASPARRSSVRLSMRGETLGETGPLRVSMTVGFGARSVWVGELLLMDPTADADAGSMPNASSALICDSEGWSCFDGVLAASPGGDSGVEGVTVRDDMAAAAAGEAGVVARGA